MPQDFQFNFGPISRTLGKSHNYLGFASLPVHEAVTALLGARNRDEFIAWLWHDTFKALFTLELGENGRVSWLHTPGKGDRANLDPLFEHFARVTGISPDLPRDHHRRRGSMISESKTITNEFGALYLGERARFVQFSFACQPVAHTMPLRACIVDAFLRAVSQVVAEGISAPGLPFDRVLYRFEPQSAILTPQQIAAQYGISVGNRELCIMHWVPSDAIEPVQLTVDLTARPPTQEEPNTLALVELLTIYRDELTTIIAMPLFLGDLYAVMERIRSEMRALLPGILEQTGIQMTHKQAAVPDLMDLILSQMVEIRAVADELNEDYEVISGGQARKRTGKPVHKLIQHPYQLMADDSCTRACTVCGSPITEEAATCYKGKFRLQAQRGVFSGKFTDMEFVGFESAICPMCLIYANSKNAGLLRGAQAFLAPSTALGAPVKSELLEPPRFDAAGRFDPDRPLPKTTVTLQEMVLLTVISRRIVDAILSFKVKDSGSLVGEVLMARQNGQEVTPTPVGVHLPYAGVYLISHARAVRTLYRDVLVGSDPVAPDLWQTVELRTYPFQLKISPAFTLLISLHYRASKFHTRHTLLKSRAMQVFLSPTASFNVLVDDAFQETVDSDLAEAIRVIRQLADMRDLDRGEFIKALLGGHDPIEAAYLAARRPKGQKGEAFRLTQAERFWDREEVALGKTTVEQWEEFNRLTERVRALAEAHPTLLSLVSLA